MLDGLTTTGSGIERRSVVAAGAWAAPVIAISAAAPMAAASTPQPAPNFRILFRLANTKPFLPGERTSFTVNVENKSDDNVEPGTTVRMLLPEQHFGRVAPETNTRNEYWTTVRDGDYIVATYHRRLPPRASSIESMEVMLRRPATDLYTAPDGSSDFTVTFVTRNAAGVVGNSITRPIPLPNSVALTLNSVITTDPASGPLGFGSSLTFRFAVTNNASKACPAGVLTFPLDLAQGKPYFAAVFPEALTFSGDAGWSAPDLAAGVLTVALTLASPLAPGASTAAALTLQRTITGLDGGTGQPIQARLAAPTWTSVATAPMKFTHTFRGTTFTGQPSLDAYWSAVD